MTEQLVTAGASNWIMGTYEIHTRETVEGVYRVEAESEDAAKAKFERRHSGPLIDFTGVEQVEYMAYNVAVTDCHPLSGQRS